MISEQDQDTRKLGRLSHMTITDKCRVKTTFNTCYCLFRGTSPASVYSLQLLGCGDIPENIVPTTTIWIQSETIIR